jgi:hypothetical protein
VYKHRIRVEIAWNVENKWVTDLSWTAQIADLKKQLAAAKADKDQTIEIQKPKGERYRNNTVRTNGKPRKGYGFAEASRLSELEWQMTTVSEISHVSSQYHVHILMLTIT